MELIDTQKHEIRVEIGSASIEFNETSQEYPLKSNIRQEKKYQSIHFQWKTQSYFSQAKLAETSNAVPNSSIKRWIAINLKINKTNIIHLHSELPKTFNLWISKCLGCSHNINCQHAFLNTSENLPINQQPKHLHVIEFCFVLRLQVCSLLYAWHYLRVHAEQFNGVTILVFVQWLLVDVMRELYFFFSFPEAAMTQIAKNGFCCSERYMKSGGNWKLSQFFENSFHQPSSIFKPLPRAVFYLEQHTIDTKCWNCSSIRIIASPNEYKQKSRNMEAWYSGDLKRRSLQTYIHCKEAQLEWNALRSNRNVYMCARDDVALLVYTSKANVSRQRSNDTVYHSQFVSNFLVFACARTSNTDGVADDNTLCVYRKCIL